MTDTVYTNEIVEQVPEAVEAFLTRLDTERGFYTIYVNHRRMLFLHRQTGYHVGFARTSATWALTLLSGAIGPESLALFVEFLRFLNTVPEYNEPLLELQVKRGDTWVKANL